MKSFIKTWSNSIYNKKRLIITCSLLFLILFIYLVSISKSFLIDQTENIKNRSRFDDRPTLILLWTTWRLWDWFWPDMICSPFCTITTDRNRSDRSSAILFHARDVDWTNLPPNRSTDQYYVFANWESPHHTHNDLTIGDRRSFFNLTMTYRKDSDIFYPYGKIVRLPINESESESIDLVIKGKTKLLAWYVSNCSPPSGRDRFVDDLKKYITVDIYGACGPLQCPTKRSGIKSGLFDADNCDRLLTKDYKFYLALENSLCRDYVTEKFYYYLDNSIIIPIVMERKLILNLFAHDGLLLEIMNRSLIAVDDFNNTQELVSYLKYLDSNATAYMEYFRWRENYRVLLDEPGMNLLIKADPHQAFLPACDLCRLVREKKEHLIKDLHNWWVTKAKCHSYDGRKIS